MQMIRDIRAIFHDLTELEARISAQTPDYTNRTWEEFWKANEAEGWRAIKRNCPGSDRDLPFAERMAKSVKASIWTDLCHTPACDDARQAVSKARGHRWEDAC